MRPPWWVSGKVSAPRAAGLGSNLAFPVGLFAGLVIPVRCRVVMQWMTCLAPGVLGSMLELIGQCQYTVTG